MGHFMWRAIRLCVPWVVSVGCGGQVASVDEALSGGGQTAHTTTLPSSGGSTSVPPGSGGSGSATSPTTAVCFGQTNVTVTPGCTYFDLNASGSSCLTSIPIPDNYKLNPAKLTLFFPGSDGSRSVIPYVGTLADCASHKTYGGWYATNITGGSSEIGLCGCSCNAARKYSVRVEIACDGIPGGE